MKNIIVAILLAVFAHTLHAEPLPQDLQYQGKPLEPYCLTLISEGDSSRLKPLSLQRCEQEKASLKKLPNRTTLSEKDFIGYEYQKGDECKMNICYAFWKLVAPLGDHRYLIWMENAGGGTGRFSSLFVLERKGDHIQNVKEITGGDRAFMSIVHAKMEKGQAVVQQRATPGLILSHALSNADSEYADLGAELPDCAVCQAGVLYRRIPLTDGPAHTYQIRLDEPAPVDENDNATPLKQRFDKAALKWFKMKHGILDEEAMNQFAREVAGDRIRPE